MTGNSGVKLSQRLSISKRLSYASQPYQELAWGAVPLEFSISQLSACCYAQSQRQFQKFVPLLAYRAPETRSLTQLETTFAKV
jgi:hypothetical protein